MSSGADLPDDVELLKALLVEARSLLAERDVEIEQLKAQIDKLSAHAIRSQVRAAAAANRDARDST